ncbi:FHA domain-containing protein [Arenimonas sp.]|uniref:FHA domain-containing protein n=1 Tax=Arenimonas sp. TaxID=1872635 RepID=UPI0039E4FB9F
MQLKFPNGEHDDVAFDQGEVAVGSRVPHGISLSGRGLAPLHASFVADRRGLWLRVPAGTPGVHLNARPVKRLAMLHIGDQVCLEQVQLVIGEDSSHVIERNIPGATPPALGEAQRVSAVRVVLRGVSGAHFGRCFTLVEPRVVGRSASCDIRIDDPGMADRHAQFELHGDRVVLRSLSQQEGAIVNGVSVRDAVLSPGDQISFDQHRFILEAPGLPLRGQQIAIRSGNVAHTQTFQAVKVPVAGGAPAQRRDDPEPTESDPSALWWLIAAAAVLAAALTALLVYSPKLGA